MISIKSFPLNLFQSNKLLEKNQLTNYITGVFLLVLAISGGFVAETLSCKVQKLLSENMIVKNVVIILILFFVLGLTGDNETPPHSVFIDSLIIWVFILIFNKMNVLFTLISFILMAILLVVKNYYDYYKKNNIEIKTYFLHNIFSTILYANIVVILIGFAIYFRKQYKEHYKEQTIKNNI